MDLAAAQSNQSDLAEPIAWAWWKFVHSWTANFGTEALADGTLPTRVVNVPQGTAITNVIISSAPVWIVLLSWVFNYFAFPVAATIVIPFAFTNEVLANVGNALGMELTSDTAGLVGRPVADSVLTSVVMPATGILFATHGSTLSTPESVSRICARRFARSAPPSRRC